ncbi:MAG: hypothetical protein ACRC60_08675, partial [Plesiomonas shigelloides]
MLFAVCHATSALKGRGYTSQKQNHKTNWIKNNLSLLLTPLLYSATVFPFFNNIHRKRPMHPMLNIAVRAARKA